MKFSPEISDPIEGQALVTISRTDYRPIVGDIIDNTVVQQYGNPLAKILAVNTWQVALVDLVVMEGVLAYWVNLKPLFP